MKIQVAGIYKENKFQLISISFYMQHKKEFKQENFYQNVKKQIINPIIDKYKLNKDFDFFLNKNSYFNIGGSKADTGLTGRKIIADTYGCDIMHGGGSFSGKDASKIDRTGAYLARFIAKNIVTNKLAEKCLIKLSYLFGDSKPNHIFLDTFSTNKISEEKIMNLIKKNFIFKLTKIINDFDLTKENFKKLSTFGSFGRNEFDLKWEKTKNLVC
jgi:S-adenosylmethionine synthetase